MSALDEVLGRLQNVRQEGSGYRASCPVPGHGQGREDRDPSLSVTVGDDGQVLLNCFANCDTETIVATLGLSMSDLFERNGKVLNLSVVRGGWAKEGCTLEAYAEKTRLPMGFLESLGIEETKYRGKPFLKIPYSDEEGKEVATRYRTALNKSKQGPDERFKWKSGSKAMLYDLEPLPKIREREAGRYVVLGEGESDVHTLRYYGFPALGIPGASTWQPEWTAHLAGVERVYILKEPDEAAEKLLHDLIQDDTIREKLYVLNMSETGYKDANEWYVSDPENFKESFFKALKEDARHYPEIEREQREKAASGLWEECKELAYEGDILARFAEDLEESGVADEKNVVETLYLIVTTRYLERPSSVAVKGPSSGGKSYTLQKVLEHHPEEAHYSLTAMSEKALAYSKQQMQHRFLVIYEATGMEGDMQSYLIRSLLSEGHIRYEYVDKELGETVMLERKGPTGLLVTTTQVSLHNENETRLLSLRVNDTKVQTKDVMHSTAQRYRRRKGSLITPSLKRWHALQRWIERAGTRDVDVPFAEAISDAISPIAGRLRRDFELVLNLIEAHAMLHQATREKDEDGFIVATIEGDYGKVRELVGDLIAEQLEASVPAIVRETVEKLRGLYEDLENKSDGVSAEGLRQELNLDKNATARRLRMAIGRGFVKNLEDKKGKPGRYVPGNPLPDDVVVLPTPEEVSIAFERTTVPSDHIDLEIPPNTFVDSEEGKVFEEPSSNGKSLGTMVHPSANEDLTESQRFFIEKLVEQGMSRKFAREEVLGERA